MSIVSVTVKAEVVEVMPDNLMDYLESHKDVVVQFTSPDRKCGHCRGADKAFDRFASKNSGHLSFVRVQWKPWYETPKVLRDRFRLIAMPAQICIRNGEKIRAYPGIMLEKDKDAIERFEKKCFAGDV